MRPLYALSSSVAIDAKSFGEDVRVVLAGDRVVRELEREQLLLGELGEDLDRLGLLDPRRDRGLGAVVAREDLAAVDQRDAGEAAVAADVRSEAVELRLFHVARSRLPQGT